jgi:xylulokinase
VAYLCFDIGSSTLKAAVLSEEGRLLGFARRDLRARKSIVDRAGETFANQATEAGNDALHWIEASFSSGAEAIAAARRALASSASRRAKSKGLEIRAISVSGHGPTLLAIDSECLPIGPALTWLDRRAALEAVEVSVIAGRTIDPTFNLPKALHLWREADQGLRDRIRWFMSCPEYLLLWLCGEALTYLPHPGFEPYMWNRSMLAALDLPLDRFPPFAAPALRAGGLDRVAASKLGLERGIPVVTGFPDFLAAIVGSATVEVGLACDRTGTSEALNLCADRPFPDRALLSLPHPVDGLWNVSGGISTAGAALEWLAGNLGTSLHGKKEATVAGLLACASLSPPGARGLVFLPYLSGERAPLWDPNLRGAFVGLSFEHGRAEMARAAAESIAYGLKLAADLARGESMPFRLLRVSGPAAQDDFLCALKANVLGVPVECPEVIDCELVGDGIACALALGDTSSLSEAAHALVRAKRCFEPEPISEYTSSFQHFKAALESLSTNAGTKAISG